MQIFCLEELEKADLLGAFKKEKGITPGQYLKKHTLAG